VDIARKAAEVEANRALNQAGEAGAAAELDAAVHSRDAGVLQMHNRKKAVIWSVFDLSKESPCCQVRVGCEECGSVPAATGGTSNYWNHLYVHHRPVWLELKQQCGQLTGSGTEELEALQKMLTERATKAQSDAVYSKLPAEATRILDRVVVDWIIDADGDKNEAELPAFRHLMRTATNGAYSGSCHQTVSGLMTQSAQEGKAIATEFHTRLLSENVKPTVSGDLWSKNGTALLGLVSHGILECPAADGTFDWVMSEVLTGAIPCAKEHHTGDHVDELSNAAWKAVGIPNPIEQIFKRKSDQGSNMIKVSSTTALISDRLLSGLAGGQPGSLQLPRDPDRHYERVEHAACGRRDCSQRSSRGWLSALVNHRSS
jgi:hypothetical protein